MSSLSSIENATAAFFTKGDSAQPGLSITNIDIGKIIELVSAIIQAAPAIEQGIMSAAPFVEAISEMIANGGKPSDEQWAALRARLDVGSAVLASAEAEAETELLPPILPIDPAGDVVVENPAPEDANIIMTHTGIATDLADKVNLDAPIDAPAGKKGK